MPLPPGKFEKFPDLPGEIRNQIWSLIHDQETPPRVWILDVCKCSVSAPDRLCKRERHIERFMSQEIQRMLRWTAYPKRAAVPALLHICRESRSFSWGKYKRNEPLLHHPAKDNNSVFYGSPAMSHYTLSVSFSSPVVDYGSDIIISDAVTTFNPNILDRPNSDVVFDTGERYSTYRMTNPLFGFELASIKNLAFPKTPFNQFLHFHLASIGLTPLSFVLQWTKVDQMPNLNTFSIVSDYFRNNIPDNVVIRSRRFEDPSRESEPSTSYFIQKPAETLKVILEHLKIGIVPKYLNFQPLVDALDAENPTFMCQCGGTDGLHEMRCHPEAVPQVHWSWLEMPFQEPLFGENGLMSRDLKRKNKYAEQARNAISSGGPATTDKGSSGDPATAVFQ